MAVSKLIEHGMIKYVVSTNCDNLHLRSGVPLNCLSSIHGDSYLEICHTCKKEHWRDYPVRNNWHRHEHETGRKCEVKGCNGELLDTIVNFGEDELEEPWNKAVENMKKSDLVIVLGSSLRVRRSCDLPVMCFDDTDGKENVRLVIVNLQKTPQDERAQMVVHSRTDAFMKVVMRELNLEIDDYLFERTYELGIETLTNGTKRLYVRDPGHDKHIATVVHGVTFRMYYSNGTVEEKKLIYRWDDMEYVHIVGADITSAEADLNFNFVAPREQGGNKVTIRIDAIFGRSNAWQQFHFVRKTSQEVITVTPLEKNEQRWSCLVL
jgi:NAD-dependent SIR2 family protein deacetylase